MSRLVQAADGTWSEPPGYEALWLYFGLSYASWLTLPRVLMHEMPDDWQARMAQLLHEFEATWDASNEGETVVQIRRDKRFIPMPRWIDYRRPDLDYIARFKREPEPRA